MATGREVDEGRAIGRGCQSGCSGGVYPGELGGGGDRPAGTLARVMRVKVLAAEGQVTAELRQMEIYSQATTALGQV